MSLVNDYMKAKLKSDLARLNARKEIAEKHAKDIYFILDLSAEIKEVEGQIRELILKNE